MSTTTSTAVPAGPSDPAGPVGHAGIRVDVTEREAWHGNGFLAVGLVIALLAVAFWAIELASSGGHTA
ncbi:MAG TPA: hypothetical protein VHN80_20595, partial [Kineosporiaceae bacterium]|nr:hypothetical protein [Kineosporiaceae bacterium]